MFIDVGAGAGVRLSAVSISLASPPASMNFDIFFAFLTLAMKFACCSLQFDFFFGASSVGRTPPLPIPPNLVALPVKLAFRPRGTFLLYLLLLGSWSLISFVLCEEMSNTSTSFVLTFLHILWCTAILSAANFLWQMVQETLPSEPIVAMGGSDSKESKPLDRPKLLGLGGRPPPPPPPLEPKLPSPKLPPPPPLLPLFKLCLPLGLRLIADLELMRVISPSGFFFITAEGLMLCPTLFCLRAASLLAEHFLRWLFMSSLRTGVSQ
mmetsp:Transcript_15323/g.28625  ORF Transcript_15323/g.28625 Transcript_15323/m.28625 type:complete len:266 (+) Transcript_15323:224-1021(+)